MATTAVLLAAGPAGAAPDDRSDAKVTARPRMERVLMAQVNRLRARRKTPRLRGDARLRRAARRHAAFLARTGRVEHDSPDGSPFWTRLRDAGIPERLRVAEVVAGGPACSPADARLTLRAFLRSPPHRRVILSGVYRRAGVATVAMADCGRGAYVIDFSGRPPR